MAQKVYKGVNTAERLLATVLADLGNQWQYLQEYAVEDGVIELVNSGRKAGEDVVSPVQTMAIIAKYQQLRDAWQNIISNMKRSASPGLEAEFLLNLYENGAERLNNHYKSRPGTNLASLKRIYDSVMAAAKPILTEANNYTKAALKKKTIYKTILGWSANVCPTVQQAGAVASADPRNVYSIMKMTAGAAGGFGAVGPFFISYYGTEATLNARTISFFRKGKWVPYYLPVLGKINLKRIDLTITKQGSVYYLPDSLNETIAASLASYAFDCGASPCIPKYFGYYMCPATDGYSNVTIVEQLDYELRAFIRGQKPEFKPVLKRIRVDDLVGFVVHVWYGMMAMQKYGGVYHLDANPRNVMFVATRESSLLTGTSITSKAVRYYNGKDLSKVRWYAYQMPDADKILLLKNNGLLPKIIDYGFTRTDMRGTVLDRDFQLENVLNKNQINGLQHRAKRANWPIAPLNFFAYNMIFLLMEVRYKNEFRNPTSMYDDASLDSAIKILQYCIPNYNSGGQIPPSADFVAGRTPYWAMFDQDVGAPLPNTWPIERLYSAAKSDPNHVKRMNLNLTGVARDYEVVSPTVITGQTITSEEILYISLDGNPNAIKHSTLKSFLRASDDLKQCVAANGAPACQNQKANERVLNPNAKYLKDMKKFTVVKGSSLAPAGVLKDVITENDLKVQVDGATYFQVVSTPVCSVYALEIEQSMLTAKFEYEFSRNVGGILHAPNDPILKVNLYPIYIKPGLRTQVILAPNLIAARSKVAARTEALVFNGPPLINKAIIKNQAIQIPAGNLGSPMGFCWIYNERSTYGPPKADYPPVYHPYLGVVVILSTGEIILRRYLSFLAEHETVQETMTINLQNGSTAVITVPRIAYDAEGKPKNKGKSYTAAFVCTMLMYNNAPFIDYSAKSADYPLGRYAGKSSNKAFESDLVVYPQQLCDTLKPRTLLGRLASGQFVLVGIEGSGYSAEGLTCDQAYKVAKMFGLVQCVLLDSPNSNILVSRTKAPIMLTPETSTKPGIYVVLSQDSMEI